MAQQAFRETYGGTAAENYDRYFVPSIGAPLSAELIEAAALVPGERVLDVACGTGCVARLAAKQVGSAGSVAGLDVNAGMLAVARAAAPADAAIQWHQSSAESMPLADGAFDAVLCQLGLQFMPDKATALSEMHRVLAPGGRLVLSVTGPTPPPFSILADALGRHINPQIAPFVHMVFSLDDPDALQALISSAGFKDAAVRTYAHKLRLPPPKDFLWQYVYSTPLAEAVSPATDEALAALERDVVAQWRAFVEEGGMMLSPRMLLATARKG